MPPTPSLSAIPRLAALSVALCLLVIAVGSSLPATAGPPPAVTVVDPEAAQRAGTAIDLSVREVGGERLLEPRGIGQPRVPTVLAASPDGQAAVISTVDRGQVGPLTIARPDRSQLQVSLPGLAGAAFELTGASIAAVDLAGAMWRVAADTGEARLLDRGPFGASFGWTADGRILAVRLAAVDAPIWSEAVWIDAGTGAVRPVVEVANPQDQITYRALALADGSVALVRHRQGGGVDVSRVIGSGETPLRTLEGAVIVDVSPDGTLLAWVEAGQVRLAPMGDGGVTRELGPGADPRFSPGASLLLIRGADFTTVFDTGGAQRTALPASVCWLGESRGCLP